MQYRINGRFVSKADFEAWKASEAAKDMPALPEMIEMHATQNPDSVTAMVQRINSALFERASFERAKAPNKSHMLLRQVANKFADSVMVASFFDYLRIDPETMFNRVRRDGTRSDLKGLKKVRTLIDYIMGRSDVLDRATFSLFASTIIAANMGIEWIAAPEQELILSSDRINSLPQDVQHAIRDYQHHHMTIEGDSRPQSCRFRTTFNNMGCYVVYRDEFDNSDYTLGVSVNMDSPVVQYLNQRWSLDRFN